MSVRRQSNSGSELKPAELAQIAADVNRKTHDIGARRLHTVLERLLDDLLYNAPDIGTQTIPITPSYVRERLGALVGGRRMWVNGTTLHYYFFDADTDASVIPVPGTGETRRVPWAGAKEQLDVMRESFREWQDLGIGVTFAEVFDRCEAELRIGFQLGDGSWSAVGRPVIPARSAQVSLV